MFGITTNERAEGNVIGQVEEFCPARNLSMGSTRQAYFTLTPLPSPHPCKRVGPLPSEARDL